MESAIWGFLGTLIGVTASIGTTMLTNWNTFRLQRENDALQRTERFRTFQRDNLLELQNSLLDISRLYYTGYQIFRTTSAQQNIEWKDIRLGSNLDENILLANKRLSLLIERIADDSLRSDVKKTHIVLSHFALIQSESEGNQWSKNVATSIEGTMSHIGDVLRSLY